jgi:phospholipid-binding lipoprotein MlaA
MGQTFFSFHGLKLALAVCGVLLVAGCASIPEDPDERAEYEQLNDPFEPMNRAVFSFNQAVDTVILEPASQVYGFVPEPIRFVVYNFVNNLKEPVNFLNNFFQGDIEGAGRTLARFAVNSTMGFAGLGNPADQMGLADTDEDFGQTLGVWGGGQGDGGPYLVLPLLGPSNPRDVVGMVVDAMWNPVNYYVREHELETLALGLKALEVVDARYRNAELIDDLERNSLDYYAAVRSFYRQRRSALINDSLEPGQPGVR